MTNDNDGMTKAVINSYQLRIAAYREYQRNGMPGDLCGYFIEKFTEQQLMHEQRLNAANTVVLANEVVAE